MLEMMESRMESSYRLTDRDIRLMIQLRATNDAIFTGRRNSAMKGWKAIRREMGLQGLLSARQLKKKWDNMKEKYRGLKNPPEGMEMQTPTTWRWFQLMDEAMMGRLAGTANVVQPSVLDEDDERADATPPLILTGVGTPLSGLGDSEMAPLEDDVPITEVLELKGADDGVKGKMEGGAELLPQIVSVGRGDGAQLRPPATNNQTTVFYATLLPEYTTGTVKTPAATTPRNVVAAGAEEKLEELQRERQALEREQAEFDRELIALERDRELLRRDMDSLERDRTSLDRERAAIERDRAAVERDRAAMERDMAAVERDRGALDRDRAFLDRDRAFVDRDRAFVDRDRVLVERAREDLERERAAWRRERDGEGENGHSAEKEVVLQTRFYQRLTAEDLDPEQQETRQRLVTLFQRLVEKL